MGSFGKVGFISSLPISQGDETTLIFLKPNEYTLEKKGGVTYSTDWYEPVFLPIFGQYDDYGKIEDIKKTDSVKFIEDFFGLPIEKIVEDIDNSSVGRHESEKIKSPKNEDLYKQLTFGLEHTSVFEKMAGRTVIAYTENYISEYWLRKLGFKLIESDDKDNDKKTFTHIDIPGYKYVGAHWGEFIDPNGVKVSSIYHPDDLVDKMLSINPNVIIKLTNEDKNMCAIDLSVNCSRLALDQHNAKLTGYPKEDMVLSWRGIEKYQGVPNLTEYMSKIVIDGEKYPHGSSKLPIKLLDMVNQKEISDMIRFNWTISTLNAKYQPSNYGSQDESILLHYEMLKAYRKVVKNKLTERLQWGDEDDVIEYEKFLLDCKADDREDTLDLILN